MLIIRLDEFSNRIPFALDLDYKIVVEILNFCLQTCFFEEVLSSNVIFSVRFIVQLTLT